MRSIFASIFIVLAVVAAGALGVVIAVVLAFGAAIVLSVATFGIGLFVLIVGWADESSGLMFFGFFLVVVSAAAAGRLWKSVR